MATIYEDGLMLLAQHMNPVGISHECVVTYAVTVPTPYSADPETICNFFQAAFVDAFVDLTSSNCQINKTTVIMGTGDDSPLTGESTVAGTFGITSGAQAPPQVAVVVKKLTGFGGRQNRGRIYLPYLLRDDDVADDGSFAGSDLSDRQDACDAWLAGVNAGDFDMVIANRVYDRPWNVADRHLTAVNAGKKVTALSVESIIGTQRRRLPRT